MSEELKPCPFCGNENIQIERRSEFDGQSDYGRYYIGCGAEDCLDWDVFSSADTPDEAIEQWNKRAEVSSLKSQIELLKELLSEIYHGHLNLSDEVVERIEKVLGGKQ